MTEPNADHLCPGCFAEKGSANPCPHCGYDELAERAPLLLPHRALLNGQFLIGRVLGKPGGFGITYLAWDLGLERRVAIKEYLPRELAGRGTDRASVAPHSREDCAAFRYGLQQFLAEARTLAQFDHPNIVRVHQVFEAHGTAYLAMDFYAGLTLADYLDRKGGRLAEAEALILMQPILDGLRAVHAGGFLHRDIKPQNIYLAQLDGGGVRPILLDFGAARQAIGERSRSLSVLVSEGYAPFEQYTRKGKQGAWTDVYAAGAVLYRMVTGLVPPAANDRVAEDDLAPATAHGASAALGRTLAAALAITPAGRLRDVPALQAALWPRATLEPLTSPLSSAPTTVPAAAEPAGALLQASTRTAPAAGATRRQAAFLLLGLLGILVLLGITTAWALHHEEQQRQRQDRSAFERAVDQNTAAAYRDYLDQCLATGCAHRDAARMRLAAVLESESAAQAKAKAKAKAEAKQQTRDAQAAAERQRIEDERRQREEREAAAEREARAVAFKPELVRIPAGSFLMGSPSDELMREGDEGPQHQVRVPSFDLGKHEVTRGQFRAFMEATGRQIPKGCYVWTGGVWTGNVRTVGKWGFDSEAGWESPGFTQDDHHPVVCVSWDDAQAYLAWLNRKTETKYRLPSEAEWEYAARAGTTTPFMTGHCITTSQANYDGSSADYNDCGAKTGVALGATTRVGSYAANPPVRWQIHDMHGNVNEWTQDCWHDSYIGAPQNGSAWLDACGNGNRRVLRGGSWTYYPQLLRSAFRFRSDAGYRYSNLGFRVAGTLDH